MTDKKSYTIYDLIRDVRKDLPQYHDTTVDDAVRTVFSELQEALVNQEKIVLKRFGSLNPRFRRVPPSNLEEFPTEGERKYFWYVFFRASKILKERANAAINQSD